LDIAKILDISRATLHRRLQEEGLSCECTYSDISDDDLDDYLIRIKHDHPNDGERLLVGHLCQLGIIVPRSQLRSSIHRVDPENTAICIQTDLGGENVEIWHYMIEQQNSLASVVAGSLTHNERIKRLWRDVFWCV